MERKTFSPGTKKEVKNAETFLYLTLLPPLGKSEVKQQNISFMKILSLVMFAVEFLYFIL
jgi:hypothetical protein